MRNFVYVGAGLLTTIVVILFILSRSAPNAPQPLPTSTATRIPPTQTSTIISSPTVSPKEHILEQVHQLAATYGQAFQSEKKNGDVTFITDPSTEEEVFRFSGKSFERVIKLYNQLDEQIFQLNQLYDQVYRDETNPTPFPTQSSPEPAEAYLQSLYEGPQEYCPTEALDLSKATIMIYDPDEGKYQPRMINDEIARCDVYG